jgi:hypothetical protein
MAQVKIDIASEFTGAKAFKKADTATASLTKSVKSLGAAFGVAFSTRTVVNFGKSAVRAFVEDDKAARTLTKTLNNLGLQFADPTIKTFISDLERQYGVLDDFLRPAYQKLITGTGDWRKSQELLVTALDLSAQSGVDLVTVSEDIANAYVGNTKGLKKYTLGLSTAELAGMNFEAILQKIVTVSKGQAANAADTYAGKIDKLTVASNNLTEAIGEALVDSFANLAGNGDIDKSISKLEAFGQASISVFRLLTGADSISELLNSVDYKYGFIPTDRKPNTNRSKSPAGTAMRLAAEKKAEQDALKRARDLAKSAADKARAEKAALAAKKLSAAIDKANLALNKGSNVFDLDKIQLAAAEKGQIEQLSKTTNTAQLLAITNDLARLQIKKDIIALEDAIASKDEAAITAATNKLNTDLKIYGALTNQDIKLKEIQSTLEKIVPKDLINLENLYTAIDLLGKISTTAIGGGSTASTAAGTTTAATSVTAPFQKSPYSSAQIDTLLSGFDMNTVYGASFAQGIAAGLSTSAAASGARYAAQAAGAAGITVVNNFGVVGDPNAAAEVISQVVREAQQRGTLTGAFGTE